MRPWHFYFFLVVYGIFFVSLFFAKLLDVLWLLVPPLFVFVLIPLLDFFIGEEQSNPSLNQQEAWRAPKVYMLPLVLYSVTHFSILAMGLGLAPVVSGAPLLLLSFCVGIYTGGLGITVAHELCHKKDSFSRFLADVLLSSVCYQHFALEHVRGHHFLVATDLDPASARRGESLYDFIPRSFIGGLRHALELERSRLSALGHSSLWSILFHHQVMRGFFMSGAWASIFYLLQGWSGLMFFIFQSAVAIFLLEAVNYIEHYGLTRQVNSQGRYEKVTLAHSWNSSFLVSNALLFNLQRHSDHHATAHLPYTILKTSQEAPRLPLGYPGMLWLALIPRLWFQVMDELLKRQKLGHETLGR